MTDPSSQRTGCAETNPFCVDEVPSNDELAADCCTTVTSKRYSLWSKTTPCQAVFISPRKSQTNNAPLLIWPTGFEANETSCQLVKLGQQGRTWLASFQCHGAGLEWKEDDEIRITKDGWEWKYRI